MSLPTIPLKRWFTCPPIPEEIDAELQDYPPAFRQLLVNRGIKTLDAAEVFLRTSGPLYDPFTLNGMRSAVEHILQAIDRDENIAVYGDYDVDGVTATTLLVQVIQKLGGKVREYIPNRFDEGYGLNNEALDALADEGIRLVVTVDCGIRSPGEARHAREVGIDLIISDHHEPGEEMPECVAVVCARSPGDPYPEKNLSGVGIAFKIAQALFEYRPVEGVSAMDWIDLVAIGTVADVVPLVGENRSLVKAGLNVIRRGSRQGIKSLAGAANLNLPTTTARDIGFAIGPRLNAAGRLQSANDSFNLLMSNDFQQTGLLAQSLDDQNRQRQELTLRIQGEAEGLMANEEKPFLVFAVSPNFQMGIVGLVAARFTELAYRPAIIGAQTEEFTRASCRSIPEFHITNALDKCADLFERYGGHAMAAGFTIRNERLDELHSRLNEIVQDELGALDLRPVLRADMEISFKELRGEFLRQLDLLEPTGLENPEALFITRGVRIMRRRTVGSDSRHLKLVVSEGGVTFDAIAFRQGHLINDLPEKVDLLYSFERNIYMGRETLQLNIRDIHIGWE